MLTVSCTLLCRIRVPVPVGSCTRWISNLAGIRRKRRRWPQHQNMCREKHNDTGTDEAPLSSHQIRNLHDPAASAPGGAASVLVDGDQLGLPWRCRFRGVVACAWRCAVTSLMTRMCIEGYLSPGDASPYRRPSPGWLAYAAGQAMTGKVGIRECIRSRGYSVRILLWSGEKYHVRFSGSEQQYIIIDDGWDVGT